MHGRNILFLETFSEYQQNATEINQGPPKHLPPLAYYALGVNEEAGELAGKVKKLYRDDGGILTDEKRGKMIDEGGDVLWYLSQFCEEIGISLSTLARRNIVKLEGRLARGTTQGSGDKR